MTAVSRFKSIVFCLILKPITELLALTLHKNLEARFDLIVVRNELQLEIQQRGAWTQVDLVTNFVTPDFFKPRRKWYRRNEQQNHICGLIN